MFGCAPDYTMYDLFGSSEYINECGDGGDGDVGGGGSDEIPNLECKNPTQIAGDCKEKVCSEFGEEIEIENNSDTMDDGNICTIDVCYNGRTIHNGDVGRSCEMSSGNYGWCNQRGECTQFLVCPINYHNCDNDLTNGCETQTNELENTNCGGCGITCVAPMSCSRISENVNSSCN